MISSNSRGWRVRQRTSSSETPTASVEGIAVDTHVMRLSQRLGWSEETDRDKIEKDLLRLIPRDKWYEVNYLLITHGRRVCDAKKPDCGTCVVNKLCPSAFTFKHNRASQ